MNLKLHSIVLAVWILNLAGYVVSVNRNAFKTCSQSGFCKRNRKLADHILSNDLLAPWQIETIEDQDQHTIKFILKRKEQRLQGNLQIIHDQTIKFWIDPVSSESSNNRYHIPDGDVVIDESLSKHLFKQSIINSDFSVYDLGDCGLSIKLSKDPFSLVVISNSDDEILQLNTQNLLNFENGTPFVMNEIIKNYQEADNSTDIWTEPHFGRRSFDLRKKGPNSFGMDISFPKSKAIYGIPEHASSLALRNTRSILEKEVLTHSDPFRLFNLDVFEYELDTTMALYGAIPIMMGHNPNGSNHRSVGVFWNNPSETWVDVYDQKGNGIKVDGKMTHWMSESGSFVLYLFAGKDVKTLQSQVRTLTGPPQLPPLFSLGYHQCRWNYKSVEDVLEVNKMFDQHALPVDVIWLDIEHTDGKKYMSWNKQHFSAPEKMISEISRNGRKMVTIVDPHLKRDSTWSVYNELADRNFAVKSEDGNTDYEGKCWPGTSLWTDYTNPSAREWWAGLFAFDKYEKSSEDLFIWNDMNEPAVFESVEMTMPRGNIHFNDVEHRDVHNLYGKYQQMSTFKGLMKRSNHKKRPFLLSRSFYAGSQQYGAVWTGDNMAKWSHLAISGPMLLSLSTVGYHFAGADVGGFFGNPSTELLVRWYQAGSMQPFFRAHAHIETKRREPWLFGETVTNFIRNVLHLRYSLLPLWYSAFEESSRTGVPPMRPMFLEFPDMVDALEIEDQWMISSSLLFKPITLSVSETGIKSINVTLPKSSVWYDYFSFKSIVNTDGFITESDLSLDKMLLYIRGGSILPRKDISRRSSKAMSQDPYTFIIAFDGNGISSGSVYIDDGESFEYKDSGASILVNLYASHQENNNLIKLKISIEGRPDLIKQSLTVNKSNCGEISDKYIEFDTVLQAIDLILHKITVYRHILLNSEALKLSRPAVAVLLCLFALIEVQKSIKSQAGNLLLIFFSSIFENILYFCIVWIILRAFTVKTDLKMVCNAIILGSFPQLLHIIFIIWDYPKDIQFLYILNIGTFTSHITATSAISSHDTSIFVPVLAIASATFVKFQIKRLLSL